MSAPGKALPGNMPRVYQRDFSTHPAWATGRYTRKTDQAEIVEAETLQERSEWRKGKTIGRNQLRGRKAIGVQERRPLAGSQVAQSCRMFGNRSNGLPYVLE